MPNEPESDSEGPGPEERYCTSCGEVIKQAAEICPECGVRQAPPETSDDATRVLLWIVVGVPVLIAITVILAAVVGTFVLGLGATDDETGNVQAGVNVQFDPASDSVTATYVSRQNADAVEVRFGTPGGERTVELTEVGDRAVLGPRGLGVEGAGARIVDDAGGGIGDGDEVFVTVTAINGSRSTIVLTKENTV